MKSAKFHNFKIFAGSILLTLSMICSLVGCQFASFTSPKGEDGGADTDAGADGQPSENNGDAIETEPSEAEPPKPLFYNRYTGLTCDEAVSSCRPVSVCIGNFDQKAQEGLSFADILIETPVAGNETRIWAITSDLSKLESIKNIAPAEPYMFTTAKAFGAICVYNGSKRVPSSVSSLNYANGTLGEYFSNADGIVATNGDRLRMAAVTSGASLTDLGTTLPYVLADIDNTFKPQSNTISSIYFSYSEKNTVKFTYDEAQNAYRRSQGGAPHKDSYNGEELSFQNVILLFCNVSYYHSASGTSFTLDSTSGGKGFCYTGGGVLNISWSVSENGTMIFKNEKGEILTLNRGKTYIGALRITDSVSLVAQ